MKPLGYTPPAELSRVSMRALIVGVVLTVLLAIGAVIDRPQFFHAYLVGFIFWIGITLGSLALLLLQHLTGGAWGGPERKATDQLTAFEAFKALAIVSTFIAAVSTMASLLGAIATVWLVMTVRRSTLQQISAGLAQISEQLRQIQQKPT